jgi:hypothetical protein
MICATQHHVKNAGKEFCAAHKHMPIRQKHSTFVELNPCVMSQHKSALSPFFYECIGGVFSCRRHLGSRGGLLYAAEPHARAADSYKADELDGSTFAKEARGHAHIHRKKGREAVRLVPGCRPT